MTRLLFCFLMLVPTLASASVDYATVTECRSWLFGKMSEADTQKKINDEVRDELNKIKDLKRIAYIQYGNQAQAFRSKENGCIVVTVWYEK